MIKNHNFQPTPPSCSCSCNTRPSAPPRMTACVRRWATVLVSAIVLMTFLTVAFVMFAVLNAQGKPSTTPGKIYSNLTKFRSLFTLSHRGSDNSPLLIVFSANYIDQLTFTLCVWYFGSVDLLI